MRTLLILRHAKSSWKDPGQTDHDRPLNKRGRRDAPRVGQLIKDRGLVPDQIHCSSAVRAVTTAEMVALACGFPPDQIQFTSQFYLAPPSTYIHHLRSHADGSDTVMVVGHNPGLESLLHALTGVDEHLPTAALARVALEIADWSELSLNTPARLVEFFRPRELDSDAD
jgi:phosphohistidine phosphatase